MNLLQRFEEHLAVEPTVTALDEGHVLKNGYLLAADNRFAERGMPALLRLRDAGASIWPFDPPAPVQVCEVWPRLSIGTLRKSDTAARAAWLGDRSGALAPDVRALAATSEDVFDAVAAAWDLGRRPALRAPLPRTADRTVAIEGAILDPGELESDLDSGVESDVDTR